MSQSDRPANYDDLRYFLNEISESDRPELLETALWDALTRRDWELASFVVEQGLSLAPVETSDFGPLYHAMSLLGDCPDVIRWLIRRGAEIERRGHNNWTPLIAAAAGGMQQSAAALLEEGAEVDASTQIDNDWTALMTAAYHGHADMIRLLLRAGANASRRCRWGRTASQIADRAGHKDVAMLIESHSVSASKHKSRPG